MGLHLNQFELFETLHFVTIIVGWFQRKDQISMELIDVIILTYCI